MKNKKMNLFKTHLKKHAAFVIFQLQVKQSKGGLNMFVKLIFVFRKYLFSKRNAPNRNFNYRHLFQQH